MRRIEERWEHGGLEAEFACLPGAQRLLGARAWEAVAQAWFTFHG